MTKPTPARRLNSLRGLLLWWIIGSGSMLILIYFFILGYEFRFGASLQAKADFEQNALIYAKNYATDPNALLPSGKSLNSYRRIADIPPELLEIFPEASHAHGKIQIIYINDLDDVEDYLLQFFAAINLIDNVSIDQLELQCEDRPCQLVYFYSYQLNDNDWLYMIQYAALTEQIAQDREVRENTIFYISLAILLLFLALALVLIKRIGAPVQRLANWADNLTLSQVKAKEDIPDFRYQELNLVADRLSGAFERISSSLEKEHRFLQHASHELRTPIAVASGNLELLEKLGGTNNKSDDETQAFDRLKWAVQDMQQLTETLLWLNRDTESMPTQERIDLKQLTEELVNSNEYLLAGKSVEVAVKGPAVNIAAPLTPCRIVLANLIRNAFQYTDEGEVLITVSAESLTVFNKNTDVLSDEAPEDNSDYGFGLGLLLVEQIAQRLGWLYQYEGYDDGRCSAIFFKDPSST
ncbi:MAG: HAMP domain-containing sensor histidine kinase [Pseudomonadota bacterium]